MRKRLLPAMALGALLASMIHAASQEREDIVVTQATLRSSGLSEIVGLLGVGEGGGGEVPLVTDLHIALRNTAENDAHGIILSCGIYGRTGDLLHTVKTFIEVIPAGEESWKPVEVVGVKPDDVTETKCSVAKIGGTILDSLE